MNSFRLAVRRGGGHGEAWVSISVSKVDNA